MLIDGHGGCCCVTAAGVVVVVIVADLLKLVVAAAGPQLEPLLYSWIRGEINYKGEYVHNRLNWS